MYHLIHKLEISGLNKALTVDDFERLAPLERDFRNQDRISYQWRIVENFDDCLAQPPVHQFLDFLEANHSILSQYHIADYTYWLTVIYCDQCAYELGLQTIKKMARLSLPICLNCSFRDNEDEVKSCKVPIEEQVREREKNRSLGP
jgi:hypothetical protein